MAVYWSMIRQRARSPLFEPGPQRNRRYEAHMCEVRMRENLNSGGGKVHLDWKKTNKKAGDR